MLNAKNIDAHIRSLPEEVQKKLTSLRETIQKAAPSAAECIKYGIPTFTLNGKNLVHFAGYTSHIGFYPAPSGIEEFKKELAPYISGKGTLKFPLDKPLPLPLIRKIVQFRVKENLR